MKFIKFLRMNLGTGDEPVKKQEYFGKKAAGAIIYAKKEKMFLVLQRQKDVIDGWKRVKEAGTWSIMISGKMDDDETDPRETARREFKEELKYHGVFDLSKKPFDIFEDGAFVFTTFIITIDSIFIPKLNWEHSSYKWVSSLEEIPSPVHFGSKRLLHKIKNKFRL